MNTDRFDQFRNNEDDSKLVSKKSVNQIKQAWNALGIMKGSIFLILLNIGFGALVKAWIRGNADKYDVLGLALLFVPMLIIYSLIISYTWKISRSKNVKQPVKLTMYLMLLAFVASFIGGFFINVNF